MANRLELTCWDALGQGPTAPLSGISHVRVERQGKFLTDSILEAHRINSPYLLVNNTDKSFFAAIKAEVGAMDEGPIDRKKLAETLLKYDIGSLLHGAFLAKKELAGGRLRVARAISAFIEAEGVRIAASGGVKNDAVNPSGEAKDGFGNVPFSRDEFTAEKITLFVNLDLAQIRGYGLGADAETMLVLMSLYKLRKLVDGDLRLRTACDLAVATPTIASSNVLAFSLPEAQDLEASLKEAIARCQGMMVTTTIQFNDDFKKGKEEKEPSEGAAEEVGAGETA
jgi:CRISPR-associated protein Csb1